MINSFEIATEGLLQDGDGQCLKTVVRTETAVQATQSTQNVIVARENGGVLVAAGVAAPVTVTPAPTEQISADRVDTQIIVQPGCGNSSGPGGVSSWNDLTDKPTEFNPAPHVHALVDVTGLQAALDAKAALSHSHLVSDVTGLEPRIFVAPGTYTFDCDPANVDNGVTDPYKFVSLLSMFTAILEFIPLLPPADNTINIDLADGDYDTADLAWFLSYGAPGGFDEIYLGAPGVVAGANAKINFNSKSTPTVIADGAWTLVSSAANWNAERAAAETANRAVVLANFPCRFVYYDVDWRAGYVLFPGNCKTNGIAYVVNTGVVLTYLLLKLPCVGIKGLAVFGGAPTTNIDASGNRYIYNQYLQRIYNDDGANIYVAHGGGELHSISPSGATLKLVIVNPNSLLRSLTDAAYGAAYTYVWAVFKCLGVKNPSLAVYGWLDCDLRHSGYISIQAGSTLPSTGIFLLLSSATVNAAMSLYYAAAAGSPWGCSIVSITNVPVLVSNYSAFITAWPNRSPGFTDTRMSTNLVPPPYITAGSAAPENVVVGRIGDLYTRTGGGAGTTLYVKESGNNTKTGWVAK